MTSGITNGAPPRTVQHVLLLGPDDEPRRALHLMLDRAGREVAAMSDLEAATRFLASTDCDAVIAPAELALQLARRIPEGTRTTTRASEDVRATTPVVAGATANEPRATTPALGLRVAGPEDIALPPILAVVPSRDLAQVQTLLAAGIDDILVEPIDEVAVTLALRHVGTLPRRRLAAISAPTNLVGDGEAMQRLRATIERIAGTKTTVLILGESGTGKELVARAIHENSPRRGRRFVAINCAAIPPALLESELFGHARGAFTDAVRDKRGLFEDADGGTLFLDEVGELPSALQAKLLRALQESEIRRVGDTANIKIDVRLVAATLRDLAEDVAAGRFREDLYYRLNVLPLRIPPLRERPDDIPQLARFFAARHAARHQLEAIELPQPVIDALSQQPWPGNVRELENVIERALVLADKPAIDLEFLATVMNVRPGPTNGDSGDELSIKKATRDLESTLIKRALGVTHGNRTNAAKLLEISHRALLYKMKEYGIS